MNEKIKKIFKGFEERGLKRDRVFEEILRVLTLTVCYIIHLKKAKLLYLKR
jgi:hypothetical protein